MKYREIGQRLDNVLKMMRLKNYEFAEKFDISKASLARYKKGERLPDPEFLLDLCNTRINLNWLLTGQGSMVIERDYEEWMKEKIEERVELIDSRTGLAQSATIDYTRTAILPIAGLIAAGPKEDVKERRDFGETIEIPRYLIPEGEANYLAFKVDGHSMEPQIGHEDILVIKKTIDWEYAHGKVCVVHSNDGATLKKVELDPANKRIILQPFNMDFKVQIIDEFQGLETLLIGVLALQLRIYKAN